MSWKEIVRINSDLTTPLNTLIKNLLGESNSTSSSTSNGNIHGKLNALITNTAATTTASASGNLSGKLQELLNRMTTTRCSYLDAKISSRLSATDANTHYTNIMNRLKEEAGFANSTMVPFSGYVSNDTVSWTYSNSKGGVLKGTIYGSADSSHDPDDIFDFKITLTVDGTNVMTDTEILDYIKRSHDLGGDSTTKRSNYFELEIPFRSSVKISTKDDYNYTKGIALCYCGFAYINRV